MYSFLNEYLIQSNHVIISKDPIRIYLMDVWKSNQASLSDWMDRGLFDLPYASLRHVVNMLLDEIQKRTAVFRGLAEHLDLVGRNAHDELLRLPAVLQVVGLLAGLPDSADAELPPRHAHSGLQHGNYPGLHFHGAYDIL